MLTGFFVSPGGPERMKSELREDTSGPSSTSDVESDSDSPTEVSVQVNGVLGNTAVFLHCCN